MKHLRLLCSLLILLLCSVTQAAYDPHLDWRQLESDHFIVYYPERFLDLAQKSSAHLEDEYLRLGAFLDHYPSQKVVVLITDHTDSANGSAQVAPQPIIKYYVTPFEDLSELMDMEDRTKSLLTHEYMHILQLDTIGGIPSIIDLIFGPWLAPNSLMPQLIVEGSAVYAESMDNSMGRLHSPLMTGYLRALALNNKLPTLDQLANARSRWPFGTAPYLIGGHLMQKMDRESPGWLKRYSHLYGQGLIPYFIMSKSLATGLSLPKTYQNLVTELNQAAHDKKLRTDNFHFPAAEKLTTNGQTKSPLVSYQGQIYFVSGNEQNDSYIYQLDVATKKLNKLARAQSSSTLAINPPDDSLFYTITQSQNSFTYFNEVEKINLNSRPNPKSVKKAPKRISQPVFSHDGTMVVYVINRDDHSELWLANSDFANQQLLYKATDDTVFYYPQFSPDDQRIVVSSWHNGGQRHFTILSKNNSTYTMVSDFALTGRHLSGQSYSADGQRLYFHSDNGQETFDIYLLTPTLEPQQCHLHRLTAEVAGAFYPLEVGDNLYYLQLTDHGYELAMRPLMPESWQMVGTCACPGIFSSAESMINQQEITAAPNHPQPKEPPATKLSSPKKYSPWFTLMPRLWMPTLSQDAFGYTLGASTSGSDILGHHNYSFSTEWGLKSYYPAISFSYSNAMLPVTISTSFSHYMGRGRSTTTANWRNQLGHKISSATLGVGYNLSRWRYSWYFASSYQFRFYRPYSKTRFTSLGTPYSLPDDRFGAINLLVSFSNSRSFYRSLHTAKGFNLSLNLQMEHPAFGSNYESYIATFSYKQYQQIPLLRSTLAWRLQGGFGYSPSTLSHLFSLGGPNVTNIPTVLSTLSLSTANYLRGFSSQAITGNNYLAGTFEWRILLLNIERGIMTLPIYFDKLHLALFCDVGYGVDTLKNFKNGTLGIGPGAELRLDVKLGYYETGTLTVGYAHGIGNEAINNFYVLFGYLF